MRLNSSQKVVVVIALGAALAVLGLWLTSLGAHHPLLVSGWVGYAPLRPQSRFLPGGIPRWGRLLIWLGLIAIWGASSLALLRPRPAGPREQAAPRPEPPGVPPVIG